LEVTKIIEDFSGWNEWYQNNKINISSLPKDKYYPNQFIILKGHNCEDYGIVRENQVVRLKPDYSPCGISHKNPEQLFALQILKNKELPLKILTGGAGTGKTLIASAHAIQKLNSDKNKINKIIIAKSMTPVGREIGFLKGDMKEKTLPWLGPFLDNFIHCGYEPDDIELLIEHRRLEITPITYIQGRSISNAILIIDEVHGYTSYPKPSKYHKDINSRFGDVPMILLSGTPTPESYSQYYHLFTLSNHSPFSKYSNFYKWANDFVDVKLKYLGYAQVKDYSNARKKDFWHHIRYHILTFTQTEAGFTTDVKENVLNVKMKPITYAITDRLIKDLVVVSKSSGKQIIADTGVKLQQKIHQLFSGTIKYEDGSTQVIDDTKAEFIKEKFKGKKIAIFYNFVAELEMLKSTFKEMLTTDLEDFNSSNKNIALQIVSGREGISLAKADYLIFLNIQFSAVSYFQAKDRLTTMDRKSNNIYWIFAENGIEEKIYKTVLTKKDYTNDTFKKDFDVKRTSDTKKNNQSPRERRLFSS